MTPFSRVGAALARIPKMLVGFFEQNSLASMILRGFWPLARCPPVEAL